MKWTDNAKEESLGCTQEVMVPKLASRLTHKPTSMEVLGYILWSTQVRMFF